MNEIFMVFFYSSYGAGYDLAARRKNATRESTATLKAWLNEHKKNPYPTKGEKIMLAIITKMTLTQVSTWFANARRRLKKENKMTWEPKNKTDDDDDALVSDSDDKDKDDDDKRDETGMNNFTYNNPKSFLRWFLISGNFFYTKISIIGLTMVRCNHQTIELSFPQEPTSSTLKAFLPFRIGVS